MTATEANGLAPTDDNVPFDAVNPGQDSGTLINGAAVPNGGPLKVTSQPVLPNVIRGIDTISVTTTSGLYSFQINVFGAAQSLGEPMMLTFQDQSGDTYRLSIVSPLPINHTLGYRSDSPNITLVSWYIQRIPE